MSRRGMLKLAQRVGFEWYHLIPGGRRDDLDEDRLELLTEVLAMPEWQAEWMAKKIKKDKLVVRSCSGLPKRKKPKEPALNPAPKGERRRVRRRRADPVEPNVKDIGVLIQALGFGNYTAYGNSDLWRGIRDRVIEKFGGRCVDCSKRAKQVHHEVYTAENLAGESLEHLVALCRTCHAKRHGKTP